MIDEKSRVERDLLRLYEIQDIINNLNLSTNLQTYDTSNQEEKFLSEKLIALEKELIIWKEKYESLEKSKISLE